MLPRLSSAPAQRVPSVLTDEEVAARVLRGETALFEVLMRRNNARLYRAIRGVVQDESGVEELMQQTYVLAWSKLAQFSGRSRFSTWLLRIGLNEAMQRLRQNRKWTLVETDDLDEEPAMRRASESGSNPEEQAGRAEAARLVEGVLDRLPEIYRVVFVLREVEGLSTAEAAEVLSISDDAVKQRLSRGRLLLRQGLVKKAGQCLPDLFPFEATRCDRVVAGAIERILQGPR